MCSLSGTCLKSSVPRLSWVCSECLVSGWAGSMRATDVPVFRSQPRPRGRPSPRAGTDAAVRDTWLRERIPSLVPVTELFAARERARRGDCDAAIPVMRQAVDGLHQAGRLGFG